MGRVGAQPEDIRSSLRGPTQGTVDAEEFRPLATQRDGDMHRRDCERCDGKLVCSRASTAEANVD